MAASRPAHRVLIYGMQSSGASLFALLVGQAPDSLTVVDLWIPEVAPPLRAETDVIVKATVGLVPLEEHLASFSPTRTILFLRHPVDQIGSLNTKSHRDYGGTIEHKLQAMDRTFVNRARFDLVVRYEALIADPAGVVRRLRAAGLSVPVGAEHFSRSADEIVQHARRSSDWCREHWRTRWGLGRARVESLQPLRRAPVARTDQAWSLARRHCPVLLEHYTTGPPGRR